MSIRLNLSGWIKVREKDVGPYSSYIIREVSKYEETLDELLTTLESTTYALEQALVNRTDQTLMTGLIADCDRALEVVQKYAK